MGESAEIGIVGIQHIGKGRARVMVRAKVRGSWLGLGLGLGLGLWHEYRWDEGTDEDGITAIG